MKIFDMHIHARNTEPNPEEIIKRMEESGVYGGCIFSNMPTRYHSELGTSFEERLEEVLGWTKGYEDRLFPILRVHPDEENIIENIRIAVERGICGFKIICADHYVFDEQCMEMLREIAKQDKPVFFHSGILWDARESSKHNRPVHWEALVNIEGLRFSMGHCSWPWIDECVALYGQFLNASRSKKPAEMFFDTTPGTPEIYREELLRKLYMNGYDTGNNVLFGTDSSANAYNPKWAGKWLSIDQKILEDMGVSKENIEKYYYNNLMRFLGKTGDVDHMKPVPDNAGGWVSYNPEVSGIIEKWYKKIGFPETYDKEFYETLKEIKISDAICIDKYDTNSKDGKRNLLSCLFMCESLADEYEKRGIDEEILCNTLSDLVYWTDVWSGIKGEMHLGSIELLQNHLKMKLFKIGKLQFCMKTSEYDIEKYGVNKGDNIIEIYVPEWETLSKAECLMSIEKAKEFLAKYFPDWDYKAFVGVTWLLDDSLKTIKSLPDNVLEFQDMFESACKKTSDAILKNLFRWDTTRYNLRCISPYNDFTDEIKKYAIEGREFFEVAGVLR